MMNQYESVKTSKQPSVFRNQHTISCWVLEKDSSCLRLFTQMVKAMCYCTIKCSTERSDSRGFHFWKQSLNHWGWTIELALVLSWNFNKNLSTNGVCCVWTRCWLELVWMSSNVLFFLYWPLFNNKWSFCQLTVYFNGLFQS